MPIGLCLIAALVLAGCTMPRAVSSLKEVQHSSALGQIELVPVTAATLPPPPHPLQASFPRSFTGAQSYEYAVLGPGDRLRIRVWESGTTTVFSGPGGSSDLGEISIDENGRIFVPYAGSIRAAGLTPAELRQAIASRLQRVVLRPQVDVGVAEKRSNLVSILGNAGKPGTYAIERGRTSLGELLAEAAPNQENPDMLAVIVRRDGASGAVRLSDVYSNPALDIALRPGDSIVLHDVVEKVTVLGAAGAQGQVRIPERDFTLVDALGEARGLNPEAADPRAVFVMRAASQADAPPMVYQFNMRQPESIALANRFVLQDNDAVLISSAPWAQIRQVLSAFAQSMATVRSAATIPAP